MPALAFDVAERRPFFRGHQQRAQAFEAVGGHPALRHEFAERLFGARLQQAAALDDFAEEQRTGVRERF